MEALATMGKDNSKNYIYIGVDVIDVIFCIERIAMK